MKDLKTLTVRISMRRCPNRNIHTECVFGYVLWGFQHCPLELAWMTRDAINEYLLAGHMSFIAIQSTLKSLLEAMLQPCTWGGDNLFLLCLICAFTPNDFLIKFINVHSCYTKIPHFKYCCLNYKVKPQNLGKIQIKECDCKLNLAPVLLYKNAFFNFVIPCPLLQLNFLNMKSFLW